MLVFAAPPAAAWCLAATTQPAAMNAAIGGAGILSVLDLLLKFNMTKVRVAGVAAGVGPSSAANLAAEALAANFTRWHDLQLNIAEWTGPFVGLMVRAPPLSCPWVSGRGAAAPATGTMAGAL